MGLLNRAKQLDDIVLGPSDSTRGFLMNAWMGLHPMLTPVWFAAAVLLLAAALVLVVRGSGIAAAECLAWSVLAVTMGSASRRLPRLPRGWQR